MIVLLAIGNPAYGKFAYNLAVSIKAFSNVPIQLIYEDSAVDHLDDANPFDDTVKIKPEHCRHNNGRLFPAKAKLMIPKYAAYDECVYLDVDAICVKDISPLISDLSGRSDAFYYTEVNGEITGGGGTHWCKERTILEHYGIPKGVKIPAINSSFVYFRKGENLDMLYDKANELLNNPIPISKHAERWGRSKEQPDELYMNIALGLCEHNPAYPSPVFFRWHKAFSVKDLKPHHYFMGFFGTKETNHKSMYDYYDRHMASIYRSFGGRHTHKIGNLMQNKFITRQWM